MHVANVGSGVSEVVVVGIVLGVSGGSVVSVNDAPRLTASFHRL